MTIILSQNECRRVNKRSRERRSKEIMEVEKKRRKEEVRRRKEER